MLRLYLCLTTQHDLPMVALAALVCAAGCYATFAIGVFAIMDPNPATRHRWGALGVLTTSGAIWATHFIAMLAFRVPFASGFLIGRTICSFVIVVAIVGVGAAVAITGRNRKASTLAGLLVGLSIPAMHYTGMSAFRTTGTITWDWYAVGASIVIAATCAALAGFLSLGKAGPRVWAPAVLLLLGICGAHFVGMSAATVSYDPSIPLPSGLVGGTFLSWAVAAIAGVVVCLTIAASRLHQSTLRRTFAERKRFEEFADFAVEGLVVCDGDRIVWANHSIETMTGEPRERYVGRPLAALFTSSIAQKFSPDREVETVVGRGDSMTPVRVITKSILLENRPHMVIAVRDQRERLRTEAEMRRLADTDPLTGLPNRARFNAAIEQMLASRRSDGRAFALLSLDLDRFKYVNDAHGHAVGDALLVRVSGRLEAIVREGTLVARIGGDEFSILARDVGDAAGIRALADRIVETLSRPFLIDGLVHEIGASVGVALAPSDGDTATVLIRHADLALYRAKDDGRGTYRMFEPGMDARMQARRGLELALRRAIARQEFQLHYQPQVDTVSGQYTGAEALIRWIDPERGVVPPGEFIAIAEETNLIAAIGEWVLHTACADAATWPAHLNVAVNLSPVQFRDPRLLSIVESALDEAGLPGHRLELEITESVLIEDEAAVFGILRSFKQLGVKISLDDFGTGYSSLGHLSRFPFDKIKIDRSFVSRAPDDHDSAAIVRAVVSLGTSLGVATTAEGVETDSQRRFVAAEGCDQIQGFLFGRPTPVDGLPAEFAPLVSRQSPCPSSVFSTAATAN